MPDANSPADPVTVVLVHGAFADASGWAPLIERLLAANVPVRAVVNPLRGIAADAGYVASFIRQIPGPVLAVGHRDDHQHQPLHRGQRRPGLDRRLRRHLDPEHHRHRR